MLIVFVVFIHNNFTVESIAESGQNIVFHQNEFGSWVQLFITQGIARCAVPLFFLFAAFLQAKKNDNYKTLLKKKFFALFVPFVLWTAIYAFYFAGIKLLILKIAPQFIANPNETALNWTTLDWFHKLLGYKLKPDGDFELPGFAYQFWFIRDLIILVILSPLFKTLIKKVPVGFFALLCILYVSSTRIYFVATQALFYYSLGLYWGMFDFNLFEKIDKVPYKEAVSLYLLCFFVEKLFENKVFGAFRVILSCIIFLKVSKSIIENAKLFAITEYLAGFSFFLFAIHTPALNELLKKVWLAVFPMKNTFFSLFEYFGVAFLNIIIGTAIGIALKKLCPPVFSVLNGGRK